MDLLTEGEGHISKHATYCSYLVHEMPHNHHKIECYCFRDRNGRSNTNNTQLPSKIKGKVNSVKDISKQEFYNTMVIIMT